MRPFSHYRPRDLDEACSLLVAFGGGARATAGGSDLLGVLKDDIHDRYPEAVVDLKGIAGLDQIRETGAGLSIGPLVTLTALTRSAAVARVAPMLNEAARSVATPQIRNVGTVGGNLCQEVRCWYYRYPRHLGGPVACLRKGGERCPAVRGDNRYHAILGGRGCFAVCPSDLAVAFSALDATATVRGSAGTRTLPVAELYTPLRIELGVGEILTEVRVPFPPAGARQVFKKVTLRKGVDFALVSVAARVAVDDGVCRDARIVLGAVAPGPFRAAAGRRGAPRRSAGDVAARDAAEVALASARPLRSNAYKVEIARTLLRRTLVEVMDARRGVHW